MTTTRSGDGHDFDRLGDCLAQGVATPRRRQRRHVAVDEERHDRHVHVRREEVQRHGDGMIDRKLLRQGGVEAALDRGLADVRGEVDRRGNGVDRHFARFVIGPGEFAVHADRENRQIVQEERVEMVGIEHHDDVGAHRGEMLLLRREQFRGFAIGAVALDEKRKDRRVRHAEPGDNLRHAFQLLMCIRFRVVACANLSWQH